jgi:hypothetical protein
MTQEGHPICGETLKKKNWNVAHALKFIRETYDGKLSPQKFCEYVQKQPVGGAPSTKDEILVTSNSFMQSSKFNYISCLVPAELI